MKREILRDDDIKYSQPISLNAVESSKQNLPFVGILSKDGGRSFITYKGDTSKVGMGEVTNKGIRVYVTEYETFSTILRGALREGSKCYIFNTFSNLAKWVAFE